MNIKNKITMILIAVLLSCTVSLPSFAAWEKLDGVTMTSNTSCIELTELEASAFKNFLDEEIAAVYYLEESTNSNRITFSSDAISDLKFYIFDYITAEPLEVTLIDETTGWAYISGDATIFVVSDNTAEVEVSFILSWWQIVIGGVFFQLIFVFIGMLIGLCFTESREAGDEK